MRRWRWIPWALLLATLAVFSPVAHTLDWAFHDAVVRDSHKRPAMPENSAIVLVDDTTMDLLGKEPLAMRWPYPRNAFSALILALRQAGAKAIVMDFTFLEHSGAEEQDLLLGCTAAATPGCILASVPQRDVVFWPAPFKEAHPSFFTTPRTGLVIFEPDADGIARHYRVNGSLAAAALGTQSVTQQTELSLVRWHGGLEEIKQRGVPVLSAGPFILAGMPTLESVGEQSPDLEPGALLGAVGKVPEVRGPLYETVAGRVVFVGANASGTFDGKPLPVGAAVEPGVLLHWTAWANLSTTGFVTVHGWPWTLASVILGTAAMALASLSRHKLWGPLLTAAGLTGVVLLVSQQALNAGHLLPPFACVAATLLSLGCLITSNFLYELGRKREIQMIFGSYVDPEVVKLLVRDPDAVRMGGERKDVTILFSDLAGFTTLSEKMSEEKLLEVINLYLQQVSDRLLSNKAYIDKYIGDAVMAVYGAPLSMQDHAIQACEGALAAQEVMAELAPKFLADYGAHVHMRVGVNTGEVIVGNMGSVKKRNYTALGDAVNLASRLEGANKEFDTAIMLGQTTARRVQGQFLTRPLALLQVKGKLEAIEVHELVGRRTPEAHPCQPFLTAYNEGFQHLLQRNFTAAAACMAKALEHKPDDKMARHWHAEASRLSQQPDAGDWTPRIKLDSK